MEQCLLQELRSMIMTTNISNLLKPTNTQFGFLCWCPIFQLPLSLVDLLCSHHLHHCDPIVGIKDIQLLGVHASVTILLHSVAIFNGLQAVLAQIHLFWPNK